MKLTFVGKQSRGSDPVPSVCVYNDETNTTLTAHGHMSDRLHVDFTCIEDAVELFHRSVCFI